MNHSYRLVWNDTTQRHVPAPETARSRGKGCTALKLAPVALLLGALLASAAGAEALPNGGKVVHGTADINKAGKQMTIEQKSHKAILHWQGFDIGAGARVQFHQPSASAVALNRVTGGNASRIDGRLGANGQVWLVNPNGVVFGKGSQVNVGGLVASTLDITNEDFKADRQVFTRGAARGGITNHGSIAVAGGGTLALLAPQVKNQGTLSARLGNVVLAGGDKVTLQAGAGGQLEVAVDPATVRTLIENKHLVMADGGQVVMSSRAADALSASVVANKGTVQARTLKNREGRILLLADMQHGEAVHSGLLDASAPRGGNGGFVETSAATVTLPAGQEVTTYAASGHTGTWLIDPNDYTIAASGGNISGKELSAALARNNVRIDTATQGTQGGNGDIHVKDAVSWSAHQLTLDAQRNINVEAKMAVKGPGKLHFNYGGTAGNAGAAPLPGSNLYVHGRVDFAGTGSGRLAVNGQHHEVINSVAALQAIGKSAESLQGRYALGSSIDASGLDFEPIGTADKPFKGSFDGLGHSIRNLTIERPEQSGVGLFGHTENATLRNVGLESARVRGEESVGALVGSHRAYGGTASIANIRSTARVAGSHYVGGLVGHHQAQAKARFGPGGARVSPAHSSISLVQVSGAVSGDLSTGGLVGFNDATGGTASIVHARVTGRVSGDQGIGGLVGLNRATSRGLARIDRSRATGKVSGTSAVGGLVGSNHADFKQSVVRISRSRATGEVSGLDKAGTLVGQQLGGLVGENHAIHGEASIEQSYSTGAVQGKAFVGGLVGIVRAVHGTSRISDAEATGQVKGHESVGGLVGAQISEKGIADISSAQATGQVDGGKSVGGLVGLQHISQEGRALISEADATGQVSGHNNVGGLIGSHKNFSGVASIDNATAIGDVWGAGTNIGGLIGYSGALAGQSVNLISSVRTTGNVAGGISVRGLIGTLAGGVNDMVQGTPGATHLSDAYATGEVSNAAAAPLPPGG